MKIAKEEKIRVVEKNLTRFDLYVCDEFFLTGTAAEVIGIVEIDGRPIGDGSPGPITKCSEKNSLNTLTERNRKKVTKVSKVEMRKVEDINFSSL